MNFNTVVITALILNRIQVFSKLTLSSTANNFLVKYRRRKIITTAIIKVNKKMGKELYLTCRYKITIVMIIANKVIWAKIINNRYFNPI